MSLVEVCEIKERWLCEDALGLNTLQISEFWISMCLSAIQPQILNLQLQNHFSFQDNDSLITSAEVIIWYSVI
jgi:hypothetical protein